MKRIYTATDREGVVHRHWLTTEAKARDYWLRFTGAPMLVDSTGRTIATRHAA